MKSCGAEGPLELVSSSSPGCGKPRVLMLIALPSSKLIITVAAVIFEIRLALDGLGASSEPFPFPVSMGLSLTWTLPFNEPWPRPAHRWRRHWIHFTIANSVGGRPTTSVTMATTASTLMFVSRHVPS